MLTAYICTSLSKLKLQNKSKFFKNSLRLGSATALGQALVILSTPVISRFYTPGDLGVFGIFLAFITFTTVGTGLRYDIAIVSADDDREADHLLVASLFLILPTSILAGLIMYTMMALKVLSYDRLPLWCAPIAVITLIMTGLFTSLRYWFARRQNFKVVSTALVSQGAGRSIVPIALGIVGVGWAGVLAGEVAGRCFGTFKLLRGAMPDIKKTLQPLDLPYFRFVLLKNWKSPAVVLPSSLLDSLILMLPLPIIGHLFGGVVAGEFFLVQRVVSIPSSFVSASVADVFHSHISEAHRVEPTSVRPLLWNITKKISFISAGVYVPLAIIAPFTFTPVFGEEWVAAARLFPIMCLVGLVGMVVGPLSRFIFVINKPEQKLVIDTIRLIVPCSSLFIMHSRGFDSFYTISLFSVLTSLSYVLYYFLILHSSTKVKAEIIT